MIEIVDSHQHFWALGLNEYPWLTPDLRPLYRSYLPDDLEPSLTECKVTRTVLVQASPTVGETDYLLRLAARTPFVAGVVGWVPFDSGEWRRHLTRLTDDPHFLGIRPMLQDIEDDNWIVRDEFQPILEYLSERGLTFDALVHERHLECIAQVARRHPGLSIVIDHGAKPDIAGDSFASWADSIAAVAELPNVFCKLSGLITESRIDQAGEDLAPYVAHLLDCFSPERAMWGSDWPVLNLRSSYDAWLEMSVALTSHLSDEQRLRVFAQTAQDFYDFG